MARLLPFVKQQFFDGNGDPLAGGLVYSYEAGTVIPKVTYTDSTGLVPNTNPVVLDANGEAEIWIGTGTYKFVITDSDGNVLVTRDNVTGNLTAAADGVDGRTVRYGTSAPGGGDGNDGDFYIRTTTNYIYGPKASGSWPAGTSLVGPTGATGAAGSNGSNGSNGTNGATWTSGSGAPSGGSDGDFYLRTSNSDVYLKSGGSWSVITNIKGATGATGSTGAAGANGTAKQELLSGTYNGGTGKTTYTLSQTPTAAGEVLAFSGPNPQIQATDYDMSGTSALFNGDTSALLILFIYRY